LLDDVQFLLERAQGQEIFLRAFRTLCEVEKQIVVALDRSPQALISEDIRLCSRLTSGLVAEIQPPAVETRVAIMHAKAHESGISLSQNVAMLLASALPNTIRDLEKGLARLVASASLQGRDIDEDFAYTVLHQLEREAQQVITVAQIQQMVAKRFGLTVRALQSRKRHRAVTFPRQIAMFLCRDLTQLAVPAIAQHFGGRNTNTVLHACGKVVHMLNTNEEVAQLLWELRHALQR
jgi:chromosomal replication initiator protein